jgi:hypothetical protein
MTDSTLAERLDQYAQNYIDKVGAYVTALYPDADDAQKNIISAFKSNSQSTSLGRLTADAISTNYLLKFIDYSVYFNKLLDALVFVAMHRENPGRDHRCLAYGSIVVERNDEVQAWQVIDSERDLFCRNFVSYTDAQPYFLKLVEG